jgi:L-asparaginase II
LTLPVVAEVVRNGFVESRHRGSVVVLAPDGAPLVEVGDVDSAILSRSSLKPLQAVAVLRAGWSPGDDEQVALACASHSGEPEHVQVVSRMLTEAGLDSLALDNTPDWPINVEATHALIRAGAERDSLHQNCSGKHAAMLAACVARGWDTATYRAPEHPLQQQVRATVAELTGDTVEHAVVDGCGAPMFSCTLRGLARAFSRIATAAAGTPEARVADSMRAHPWLVGGTGRDVTALMQAVDGLIAKDGAEGVYAAATRDGIGLALKVDDGASRGRAPLMVNALRSAGVDAPGLEELATLPVLGHGERVGDVRAVLVSRG